MKRRQILVVNPVSGIELTQTPLQRLAQCGGGIAFLCQHCLHFVEGDDLRLHRQQQIVQRRRLREALENFFHFVLESSIDHSSTLRAKD